MTGLLRAELRKLGSTRLWWALLLPVVVLSVLINLFAGVFANEFPDDAPAVLVALAYALGLTSVFAAVHGIVAMSAEFRHRTITTTYLTARGRGRVLLAKTVSSALVGAGYAVATVLVGVLTALVSRPGSGFPPVGALLMLLAIGVAVAVLWSALGTALGAVITNQAAVLVVALGYLLLGELMLSLVLTRSENVVIARMAAYLPGNAGDVALFEVPASALGGPIAARVVETFTGVVSPPPWWGGLLVLAAWTVAATATAWVVGGRRDIT